MKKLYFLTAGVAACALSFGAMALTSGQLTALSASAVLTADWSLKLVSTTPLNNATEPLWNAPKVVKFNFSGPITVNRESGVTAKLVKPYMFGSGYSEKAVYAASDESRIYVNPLNANELIVSVDGFEFDDAATGYMVVLEEGLLSSNGAVNPECETRFYLQDTPKWETTPASGTLLGNAAEELQNVTIAFSGTLNSLEFAEDVASQRPRIILYRANSETSERTPVGIYTPTISGTKLQLALTVAPGMEVSQVYAPESYEIEVPSGLVYFLTKGGDLNGSNVTVLIKDLVCESLSPEWGELTEHLTYNVPGSLEANPGNTRTPYGVTAMGVLGFGVNTNAIEGVAGSKINYYYSSTATGDKELLKTIDAGNTDEVFAVSVGSMDDDPGLLEFPPVTFLYMNFAGGTDGEVDMEAIKTKYSNDGYYILEIPDGAFLINGELMHGLTLTYHYDSTNVPVEFEYTLTPAAGTEVKDPASVFGIKGSGIVLEVKDATFIDYRSQPATLTMPDGTVLTKVSPVTNFKNTITWTFGTAATEWTNGEYTFTIEDNKIGVNMGFSDDWSDDEECNFPGLTAIYSVDTNSAVLIIGAEGAEAYTVVTLDGKVILKDAPMSQLHGLAPGVYVINGKKAVLRK